MCELLNKHTLGHQVSTPNFDQIIAKCTKSTTRITVFQNDSIVQRPKMVYQFF